MKKTAVLLVNLGTPEAPQKRNVRRFLSEFLNDPRVIDLPFILRKILVNLIIVPFRAGKSCRMYQKIWTDKGSPIMVNSKALLQKLRKGGTAELNYFLAMRYGNPSIYLALDQIQKGGYEKIILLPLYPQYASSTSGSIIEKCMQILKSWVKYPHISIIAGFYHHPKFLDIWVNKIKSIHYHQYDHILFVFHGLPLRQVEQTHPGHTCVELNCKSQLIEENKFCYQAQCYHNTRLLAAKTEIDVSGYTVCYQSRFGKNWLVPFADKVIEEKAAAGIKKMLLVPLSFVADCLETKLEIEMEYDHLFKKNGGQQLTMIESLNSGDDWVDAIKEIAVG